MQRIAARSEILTEAWFNAVFGSSQAGTRRTARGELTAVERSFEPGGALGPVDIQRSQIMAPTRNNMAAKDTAVFS
jgi:hypothetical protein